jgi:hypothetical protein
VAYIGPAATYRVAEAVGGGQWDPIIMTAIAGAESGWNTTAISPTQDYGLWQINFSAWLDLFRTHTWTDPTQNGQMAFAVWRQQGYHAWTTYFTGAYRQYMGTAESVAGGGGDYPPSGGMVDTPAPPSAGGYDAAPLISGAASSLRRANSNLVRWGNAIAAVPSPGGF